MGGEKGVKRNQVPTAIEGEREREHTLVEKSNENSAIKKMDPFSMSMK